MSALDEMKLSDLKKMADNGKPGAQQHIAYLLTEGGKFNGTPVNKDIDLAFKYLKMGSDGGDADCMVALGALHLDNNSFMCNRKALKLFEDAAELGNKIGMYNTGMHYAAGRGCFQDYDKASKFFTKSALAGYEPAIKACEEIKKFISLDAQIEMEDAFDAAPRM